MKYDYAIRICSDQINWIKNRQKRKPDLPIKGISKRRRKHVAELNSAIEVLRKEREK